jgi:4-amino-4-deoxy-L-arabinose transferase-like glycosyltransferase
MPTTQDRQFQVRTSYVITAAVVGTVVARLALLGLPAWPDEAGFLTVGSGWRLGGSSTDETLYGNYWVDRPPLLIGLYGLADRLGGLEALRYLGALAAAVTVVCIAWIAHLLDGPRAAQWAAVTGAALLSTPFHWSFMVDGELLAAPFVAAGIGCLLSGLAADGRRGLTLTFAGGAAGAAAILTKQNVADVAVFATALFLIGLLLGSVTVGKVVRHAAAFLAGVMVFGGVVAAWTVAHGTSLGAVFYAMYPFRIDAARATSRGLTGISWNRVLELGVAALLSGLLLLIVWVAVWGLRRRNRRASVLALLVLVAVDLLSVAGGTSYWLHYLIQPVVAVAALTGIVAARESWARALSVGTAVMALLGWSVLMVSPPQTAEELVGKAIAGASRADDSIVTVPGRSNVNYAAGLPSPYPYLWGLPARTRDPGRARLKELLAGPAAPTWVVAIRRLHRPPRPGSLGATILQHYRPVAHICGKTVYLNKNVERRTPTPHSRPDATRASRCESVTVTPHLLRELS